MRSSLMRKISLLILALLLLATVAGARAFQGADGEYFDSTGYWLRGEFLRFYRDAPAPERLFGSPISDPIPDPIRPGIQVQYFERARMDYNPARPEGERVTLANLGQTLRDDSNPGEALNFSTNSNMCRAFDNGRLVCYAFLQFYDRYQGETFFGQPISDTENLDGRLVQYFERARMEWRLDRPTGERVVLTELGRIDFDMRVGHGRYIHAERLSISANAFIHRSVLATGQQQTVYVVVQDQRRQPVPDAAVLITVRYPDGTSQLLRPEQLTNSEGFTSAAFTVENVQPNQIISVSVTAELPNGPKAGASTWFRIWW